MKRIFRMLLMGMGVFTLVTPLAVAGGPSSKAVSVSSERARTTFDLAAYERSQYALQGWLASERVEGANQSPIVVDITREEMRRLAVNACEECTAGASRQTIGMIRSAAVAVSFPALSPETLGKQAKPRPHGAIRLGGGAGQDT